MHVIHVVFVSDVQQQNSEGWRSKRFTCFFVVFSGSNLICLAHWSSTRFDITISTYENNGILKTTIFCGGCQGHHESFVCWVCRNVKSNDLSKALAMNDVTSFNAKEFHSTLSWTASTMLDTVKYINSYCLRLSWTVDGHFAKVIQYPGWWIVIKIIRYNLSRPFFVDLPKKQNPKLNDIFVRLAGSFLPANYKNNATCSAFLESSYIRWAMQKHSSAWEQMCWFHILLPFSMAMSWEVAR